MTPFATDHPAQDERVREAWSAYSERLGGLDGRAYDEAESLSWDELQETLRAIEAEHAGGAAGPDGSGS